MEAKPNSDILREAEVKTTNNIRDELIELGWEHGRPSYHFKQRVFPSIVEEANPLLEKDGFATDLVFDFKKEARKSKESPEELAILEKVYVAYKPTINVLAYLMKLIPRNFASPSSSEKKDEAADDKDGGSVNSDETEASFSEMGDAYSEFICELVSPYETGVFWESDLEHNRLDRMLDAALLTAEIILNKFGCKYGSWKTDEWIEGETIAEMSNMGSVEADYYYAKQKQSEAKEQSRKKREREEKKLLAETQCESEDEEEEEEEGASDISNENDKKKKKQKC